MKKTQKKPLADVFAKKVFFKISKNLGQSTCIGVFVSKVADFFQPATSNLTPRQVVSRNFPNYYKHSFNENVPGTAFKGSSYLNAKLTEVTAKR